jgi:hypothetical protein
MAFIRWKHNGIGGRQAYLVHAYRGPDGKPKQKVLAYLGDSAELMPEQLALLRQKHTDLKVNWEKIKPAERPRIDVSTLSDGELLRKIRHLRHQLGLSQRDMVHRLRENGLPACSGSDMEGYYPYHPVFGKLEKAFERGEPQDFYLDPQTEVVPALRKLVARST